MPARVSLSPRPWALGPSLLSTLYPRPCAHYLSPPPIPAPVSRRPPVSLLSATAGLTVANLYYSQPLLADIGRSFGVPEGRAALVSTATQVGYAVGLFLFVPLGDVLERRRLIAVMLLLTAAALGGVGVAPALSWMLLASLVLGAATIVPQLIVPLAAGLARPAERGQVVGRVVAGILIGILAARTVSGVVGAAVGWRWLFAGAAVLMLLVAAVLARLLPPSPPAARLRYGALLRSLAALARADRVLRDASFAGAMLFGAFSAFWTTLAFRLETPPLHYGSRVAGLFGIVGIVGAMTAPLAGRFADRRRPRELVGIGIAITIAAYVAFLVGGHTIAGLVVGVIVLDAGTQIAQVANQARIYSRPAEAHSRLNTVYMVSYFAGGSLGSALGAWAWSLWRWTGVCAAGLLLLALAAIAWVVGRDMER